MVDETIIGQYTFHCLGLLHLLECQSVTLRHKFKILTICLIFIQEPHEEAVHLVTLNCTIKADISRKWAECSYLNGINSTRGAPHMAGMAQYKPMRAQVFKQGLHISPQRVILRQIVGAF